LVNTDKVEEFLKLYDTKSKIINNAKRTYYPANSLKDKIFSKVSQLNFIMGWTKKMETTVRTIINKGSERKFNLNIFDYKCENFTIKREARVSRIEVNKLLKYRNEPEFIKTSKQVLGVKLGDYLTIDGFALPKTKCPNQRFKFSDPEMISSIYFEEIEWLDNSNMNGFYATGSWHTNKTDIEKFGLKPGNDLSHWQFYSKIKGEISKLKFPTVDRIPSSNEVFSQGINPYSDSGFFCSKLYGKTKKDAFTSVCEISYKLFNKIYEKFTPDTSLWNVGGRERLHKPNEDGDCEIRSRAVLSPEMVVSQICQVFARPITDGLKLINLNDFSYPLHLGSDVNLGKFRKLIDKCKKYKQTFSFDWSKYDQSIGQGQIVLAFAICRSSFPRSKYIDNMFLFLLSSFMIKRIVGDGGIVYKISKGVATGHPFTSIINTIINFINFSYLEKELSINFEFKKFYGDDTIMSSNDNNINIDNIISASLILFGMTLKTESSSGFTDSSIIKGTPGFLKWRSLYGLPSRENCDIIDTISFYRKRKLRNHDLMVGRALSLLYISPFNKTLIKIIKNYCSKFRTVFDHDDLKALSIHYFNIDFESVLHKARLFMLSEYGCSPYGDENHVNLWFPGDDVKTRDHYKYFKLE